MYKAGTPSIEEVSPGSGELEWTPVTASGGEPIDQVDDAALSAANGRFYQALESADIDLMTAVWAHSPESSCAHPGRSPLIGWEAIEASWRAIFGAGGNPQVIITEERVIRRDAVGWVTVAENMISDGHTGAAVAINVFHHDGRQWRMLAHHAAPVLSLH